MLRLNRLTGAVSALALSALMAAPALAEDEVVMQDPGGAYGDALREIMYDPFEKETGIDVVTVQEARSGPRIKAQVEAGKTEWDLTFIFDQETKLLGDCCLADIDYGKLSPEAQETLAQNHYRVTDKDVAAKHAAGTPEVKLVTVDEVFGGWDKVRTDHLSDGGILDQVFVNQ